MNTEKLPPCFTAVIEHLHFRQCHARLLELLKMSANKPLIIVTGPTGVGKSTSLAQLRRSLTALAEEEMRENPEVLPFGGCSVKAHGQTAFSWKDTYIQLLRSLQHPFPEATPSRMRLEPSGATIFRAMSPETARRMSNDGLFRVLQKTIEHRKPRAILLDEAHHLLRVGSSQSLHNQLEHLKYIADETQTPHILFGTYELTKLLDLSSALIRRREIIHFPRYRYETEDPQGSLEPFAEAVAVFERDLREVANVELLDEVPYLYQGAVGCVGVLRQWLHNAWVTAATSRKKITKALLDDTGIKTADKKILLTEILEGEAYFEERMAGDDEYLRQLGFQATEEEPPDEKKPKRRLKPGQRKPHRDRVGFIALDPANQNAS